MSLSENEIHIYQSKLDLPIDEVTAYEKILSEDELQKANRFKFEKDRIHYIVCRSILRKILSNYLNINPYNIKFSYSEKGKPFLRDNQLKFNLAHSKDYAVYAVILDNEVGIDIEYLKDMPDALQIAERFFSQEEINQFKKVNKNKINSPRRIAFFNCWTRKEAFIKAIGDGLSYPLENFSVTLKPGDKPKILWIKDNEDEAMQWALFNLNVEENYVASLAIKRKDNKIVYKDFV